MSVRRTRDRIQRRLRQVGLELPASAVDQLETFITELARWNEKINLTAFRLGEDPTDEALDRLVVEPLLAARHLPSSARDLLDIGSGGGSPAVPLKVARPSIRLTMVEVKVRKSAFLRQLVRRLALSEAQVENLRVEELLSRPEFHGRFDVVSIRALRLEPSVWSSLQSLLAQDGQLLHFTTMSKPQALLPPFHAVSTHILPTGGILRVIERMSDDRRFT